MIGAWGGDLLLRSSLELDLWTHMQSLRVTKMGLTFSSSCFMGVGLRHHTFLRSDCLCIIHAVWPLTWGRLSNADTPQPFTKGETLCLGPRHHHTED